MRLVECIPNFSEGRSRETVEAIVEAIRGGGVRVLDVQSDSDHNRSVVTFVGAPEACARAVLAGARVATTRIDLTKHAGAHPRIGATDVVPFVPIQGVAMAECVALAHGVGERLWKELKVPTYFYEEAAKRPERRNLEEIRKGQFEGLREAAGTDPARRPDVGGPQLHPTAGATVVGARAPLIAYNVNLESSDLDLAKRIARAIRASSGGFPCVKAMGVELRERGIVQVSMNLTDFRTTPIARVFLAVEEEAKKAGVRVAGSEVVGLVPMDALIDVAAARLQLERFRPEQVLERRLLEE